MMDDAIGVNTHIITFDPPTGPWTDEPLPFEVGRNYPIIPGVLAFAVHPSREYTALQIERNPDLFFNSSMEPESYRNYCSDFGPVDLGLVVQFCRQLRTLLHDPRLRGRPVIYYSQLDEAFCTNTAFLLGAYLVLVERWSPEAAAAPLERIEPSPFKMFRDATDLPSDFDLSIRDCLRGLAKAAGAGFFDLESFDCDCFSAQDECGMSVVCPKFIAFKGPASGPNRPSYASEPEIYIEPFRHAGVSDVVRLNEASTYAPRVFEDATFRHHDMQFPDCTTPPLPIIERFLKTADEARGVVAVHCLAGLGRTATLIGIWIMGKYGWGARETIAWLRIVRPGSVIGPQQHFLLALQGQATPDIPGSAEEDPESAPRNVVGADAASDTSSEEEDAGAALLAAQVTEGLARRSGNAIE